MSTLNFWTACKSLETYLLARRTVDGLLSTAEIHAGVSSTPPTKPMVVEISWDEEEMENFKCESGTIILWVDCWVKLSDRSPGVAAEALFGLNEEIIQLIFPEKLNFSWMPYLSGDLGKATKVIMERVVSDGNTKVPATCSRMILRIEWKK